MPDRSSNEASSIGPIPDDDPARSLVLADPDGANLKRVSIAGGIYTILVSGHDTQGRYTLIEMLVPPGGGPPPHRHDFEEMFTVLEGEIELTFRGDRKVARAGQTVNVPANALHSFKNMSQATARLLCMCAPAGQDEFFLQVGDPVESRDARPPVLDADQKAERGRKAMALAPRYRTEMAPPSAKPA